MMQAYLFMKGPGTDMEDPLLVWMSKQEEENLEEGECGYVVTRTNYGGRMTDKSYILQLTRRYQRLHQRAG